VGAVLGGGGGTSCASALDANVAGTNTVAARSHFFHSDIAGFLLLEVSGDAVRFTAADCGRSSAMPLAEARGAWIDPSRRTVEVRPMHKVGLNEGR
jgi:hypothetical protein